MLQRICDALQPGTISVFFQRWLHLQRHCRSAPPISRRATGGSARWPRSRSPAPSCSPSLVYARAFFDALVTDNLDLGRPDTVEIIFDRQVRSSTAGEFRTNVITRGTEVTINAFYKHSRIKQYLKDGRALRVETVVNAPGDLGCQRRLHNLDELQARARAVNARLLHTERACEACVLANPVFERIAHPSVTADGAESYSHALWRLSGPGPGLAPCVSPCAPSPASPTGACAP